MTEKEAYKQLENKCPTRYRINELILFCYPVRRIKIDVLANKQPDGSLVKVYNIMLRSIQMGFDTQEKLFGFLGLDKDDEFMFRELFALREKRYVDLVSEKWHVASEGERFLNDEKILRVEENEEFEFLLDGISGEVISPEDPEDEEENTIRECSEQDKRLETTLELPVKSPDLLDGKYSELAELFKLKNQGETLISYDPADITNDYREWCQYWLVEYVPDRKKRQDYSGESKLEVRSFNSLKRMNGLTRQFNAEYQHYIYKLTNSERTEIEEVPEITKDAPQQSGVSPKDFEVLGIWETKQQFINALKQVKEKILIESPWLKQATREYIPLFEDLLKNNKRLIILYGISEKDEHHIQTLEDLKSLQQKYNKTFALIHLPTHMKKGNSPLTGTHRKLLIKDNEYYISGSYNFLSFGKQEQDKVANEEAHLIRKGVKERWEQVINEYGISNSFSQN